MRAPTLALAPLRVLATARLAATWRRQALLAAAIAVGVAMGFAIELLNRAAVDEFGRSIRSVSGEAELAVLGSRSGFPESLFARVAQDPAVAVASPVVELDASLPERREPVRLIGIDVLRALAIDPRLFGDTAAGAIGLLDPDCIAVSAQAARSLGVDPGSTLRVRAGSRELALKVIAVLPAGALHGEAVIADIALVQWRFERLGMLNRIDVRSRSGADLGELTARIAALLPPGVEVVTPGARVEAVTRASLAYRVNLGVLALVALFTGGFLVFSSQAQAAIARRREFALLRTVGLTRRRLVALVVGESLLLGLLGSIAGILLGFGLAVLIARALGADLGAGQFRGMVPVIAPSAQSIALFLALGIAAAVFGAVGPATAAAAEDPAKGLRAGQQAEEGARAASPAGGLLLLVVGAAIAFVPGPGSIPWFGYLAIALIVLSAIRITPWIAALAFVRLPPLGSPIAALALAQLRAAPRIAGISAAAVVASMSVMVAMAIMVHSFRGSVDAWLGAVLPAELYVRIAGGGDSAWLDVPAQQRLRELPSLARIEFQRSQRLLLDPALPPVTLLARDLDPARAAIALPLVESAPPVAGDALPPLWASEALVDLYGVRPGAELALPLAGQIHRFRVRAIWRDYARQHGAVVIERSVYRRLTGDDRATDAALWARADRPVEVLRAEVLADASGALLDTAVPGEIRRVTLSIFDRTFVVTHALEAVAMLVGLAGLATSLASIVLARASEFGMLRHVGMTRGQVLRMVMFEGEVIAMLGTGVGIVVGLAVSVVLVYAVNRQSFHWSIDLVVPWSLVGTLAAATLAAGLAVSWWAGRRAVAGSIVQAVRGDG